MAECQSFASRNRWIIAIGASGPRGLDDVKELLGEFSPALAGIIIVVLHRPWDRVSKLRVILAAATALPVIIAANGERLETGTVYIGEPSLHATLAAGSRCDIIDDPDRKFGNRTIDLLFKSVAAHAGPRMIGVLLSGSLDDGSRGLEAIHDAGGITMVRNPLNSFWGDMPRNAIRFGSPVDLIGDFRAIAQSICITCAVQNSGMLLKDPSCNAS